MKDISIVLDRKFIGELKSITISRSTTGKYFASILVDNKKELPKNRAIQKETAVGVDLGLYSFAITSDGKKIDNPRCLRNSLARIKILQWRMRNKKRSSKNSKRAYKKIAILYEKTVNQRNDFLHKLSRNLVNSHDTIIMETLNVKGMMKNHKRALSIADAAWGEFVRQIKYKCAWSGKNFFQVPMFFASSKTCSHCGAKNELLTLDDREWTCASCGIFHDRDVNSGKNVKQYFFETREGISGVPVEQAAMKGCDEAGKLNLLI